MADQINRLNDRRVRSLKKPGRYADGGGLYLRIEKSGSKNWVFMSWRGRRSIEIGLGGVNSVPLAKARQRSADCRVHVAERRDRRLSLKRARGVPTFGEFSKEMIASWEKGWRNPKHRQQWRNTLATYAAPLNSKRVDQIATEDILAVLTPIWLEKPETAKRVRGRIEKVLDGATGNVRFRG